MVRKGKVILFANGNCIRLIEAQLPVTCYHTVDFTRKHLIRTAVLCGLFIWSQCSLHLKLSGQISSSFCHRPRSDSILVRPVSFRFHFTAAFITSRLSEVSVEASVQVWLSDKLIRLIASTYWEQQYTASIDRAPLVGPFSWPSLE